VSAVLGSFYVFTRIYDIWLFPLFSESSNPYNLERMAAHNNAVVMMLYTTILVGLAATAVNWVGYFFNNKIMMGVCIPIYLVAVIVIMGLDCLPLYGAMAMAFFGFLSTNTDNSLAMQVKRSKTQAKTNV
jgi:hypothetical protein